jgi:hypothetical protein
MNITEGTWSNGSHTLTVGSGSQLTIDGGTLDLGSGLLTCNRGFALSAGTLEMNGNTIVVPYSSGASTIDISGGVLNLSGLISADSTPGAAITVSGGTINDVGTAGEMQGYTADFTGGTSVIRQLTLQYTFSQSGSSDLTIVEGATWDAAWTWSGTDFTFTTSGVPTWSNGVLTVVGGGGGGGGAWTFC